MMINQKSKVKNQKYKSKFKSFRKKLPYFLLFTFYFLLFTFPVYAQGSDIGQSRINPASPLYFLKSVREILELKFAGTGHVQSLRQLEFATRRIREVNSLVNSSREDLIEPTLERYLFHLQELMAVVNLYDEEMATQVGKEIAVQMNTLLSVYDQAGDAKAKRSIRSVVYRLSDRQQQIIIKLNLVGKPPQAEQMTVSKLQACIFLSKEASSSALNEVERVVLAARAQKCLTIKQ